MAFNWGYAEANNTFGKNGQYISKVDTRTGTSQGYTLKGSSAKIGILEAKAGYEIGGANGTAKVQGPGVGYAVGLNATNNRAGLDLMGEASAAKAEVTCGPLFVEGNINCNTGFKLGTDGVKLAFLGWGATLGAGGRWSFDTSFGSFGGKPPELTNENRIKDKQLAYAN